MNCIDLLSSVFLHGNSTCSECTGDYVRVLGSIFGFGRRWNDPEQIIVSTKYFVVKPDINLVRPTNDHRTANIIFEVALSRDGIVIPTFPRRTWEYTFALWHFALAAF